MTSPLPQLVAFLRTAPEGTHQLLIGRTRYTLYARPGARALLQRRNRKQEESPPPEDHHAKALQLYGSEAAAATAIRRQLSTMGTDVDPGVRHRATRLADQLAKGHFGKVVADRVYIRSNRSISIWLRLLNRVELVLIRPTFSMEDVEKLRRLGITISLTS
jgi:hypothetical protein